MASLHNTPARRPAGPVRRRRAVPQRLAVAGLAAGLAAVLAGCGSNDPNTGREFAQPGAASSGAESPGLGAGPGLGASPTASATGISPLHNDADVTFVRDMAPHHAGALAMASLAATRASRPEVKDLATRIAAAQRPEQVTLADMAAAWGTPTAEPPAGMSGEPSGGMSGEPSAGMSGEPSAGMSGEPSPGMSAGASTGPSSGPSAGASTDPSAGMSAGAHSGHGGASASPGAEMDMGMGAMTDDAAALGKLSGAAFDREFLTRMITHHEAALPMARAEITGGSNPQAQQLAQSILTSQTAEIAEMRKLLAS